MADPNDDEWLYGAEGEGENIGDEEASADGVDELQAKNGTNEFEFEEAGDDEHLIADDTKDHDETNQDASSEDDDDDDDDDINVVIGDIKSGGPSARFGADQKQKQPGSKFNIEEFESVGTINGQPSIEFAIESIEDKPWRKPGADITDYFNYGFNEETWRAYCERQKRMRIHESGIGLASLTAAQNPQGMQQILATGSAHEGGGQRPIHIGFKRGPRLPKPPAVIDVIGSASQNPNRPPAPRENIIQVMTADRREYSRTVQPPMQMQPFNIPPEEFYNHEEQDFGNYGYEPTQDSQWDPTHPQPWAPGEIKQLTPLNQPPPNIQPIRPLNVPPPHHVMLGGPQMIPPLMGQQQHMPMHIKQEMDDKRDVRRMAGRDMRDDGRRHDDRKRMRERSTSREKDPRKSDRRDERSRPERERYARESSSRRRSKSREKKRSRSREKSRRSRSKERKTGDDKDRARRDDKSSSKRPSSSSVVVKKEEL